MVFNFFLKFDNRLALTDPEPLIIKTAQGWSDQLGLWFISTDWS